MAREHRPKGFLRNQRNIPAQDQQLARELAKYILGARNRMASAKLPVLRHPDDVVQRTSCFYCLRAMADDDRNQPRVEAARCVQDV